MSWIRLRKLGCSPIPELLGAFSWSLRARNLNPSLRHHVTCITEIWGLDLGPIVPSCIQHDILVETNIAINTTNVIHSNFVCIRIGYWCPWAPIYAIICSDNDLLLGEFWTFCLCFLSICSSSFAELRSGIFTQADTNLNTYKFHIFIPVLLPSIVIIIHIIKD